MISLFFYLPSAFAVSYPNAVQTSHAMLAQAREPVISYQVVRRFNIEPLFLQGLTYDKGSLYISSGLYRHSFLLKLRLPDMTQLSHFNVSSKYFAEGITRFKHAVYNLNYQSDHMRVLSLNLKKLCMLSIPIMSGWGLTHDKKNLIVSDGSDHLYFLTQRDEKKDVCVRGNLMISKKLTVHFYTRSNKRFSLYRLNELAYFHHTIYANLFLQHKIAIIDALTGEVLAWIDIGPLQKQEAHYFHDAAIIKKTTLANCVSNGVTVMDNGHLLVGGKCWHHMYEIKLKRKLLYHN